MSGADHTDLAPRERQPSEPLFDEPWQAQALGLASILVENGIVPPGLWSETLGAELRTAEADGKPDDQNTYYRAVLATVEKLALSHTGMSAGTLGSRIEEWRRAYLNTPHGQPVELKAGQKD